MQLTACLVVRYTSRKEIAHVFYFLWSLACAGIIRCVFRALHVLKGIFFMGLPLFYWHVPAGFPSPAEDWIEKRVELTDLLIPHPASTFFVRVSGDSMIGAAILDGDILIVDRAREARHNSIVIAVLDGEFTVKRLQIIEGKLFLTPENPAFPVIDVSSSLDFEVWGVVTYCIHQAR